jgi:hypothetical protein
MIGFEPMNHRNRLVRLLPLLALLCVSGCSWFHHRKPMPDPAELIVTGAPAGSIVFVDGVQVGELTTINNRPQILDVTPGTHIVEVRRGETVAYRENTYVAPSEKHVIRVLSGINPE